MEVSQGLVDVIEKAKHKSCLVCQLRGKEKGLEEIKHELQVACSLVQKANPRALARATGTRVRNRHLKSAE